MDLFPLGGSVVVLGALKVANVTISGKPRFCDRLAAAVPGGI
jgi:hypothetical protein